MEPIPKNFRFPLADIEANGLTGRVLAEVRAVSKRRSELILHLGGRQISTHSPSAANLESFHGTTTTPPTDLDTRPKTWNMPPADPVKIDVAGYDGFEGGHHGSRRRPRPEYREFTCPKRAKRRPGQQRKQP